MLKIVQRDTDDGSLSEGALTVFWWLVDLVACGVLISWITILTNHLRLVMAMKKQKIPLSELPWHNRWTGGCKQQIEAFG